MRKYDNNNNNNNNNASSRNLLGHQIIQKGEGKITTTPPPNFASNFAHTCEAQQDEGEQCSLGGSRT